MSIHEGVKRLTWTTSETVKELSASISVDVDAYPMFSTSVGRICVTDYNRRSFLYTCRWSIARKHSHELSTTSRR